MGRADVYESDYLENAEVFADLVNGVLYQGKAVVKPQELEEQDGELRSLFYDDVKKAVRDKVKLWRGTVLAVLVVENQTKVDYRMVTRAMLSESMAYDKQWKEFRVKNRAAKSLMTEEMKNNITDRGMLTEDEFISGMRKKDRFIPVITIVVYFGKEKPWDGAKTLYELLVLPCGNFGELSTRSLCHCCVVISQRCHRIASFFRLALTQISGTDFHRYFRNAVLDVKGEEETILPFITNYRLNLFDYHEYDDFERFHSELQTVFEFLRYAGDKELMRERLERHRERYAGLSGQAKVLLTRLTNIKKIPGVGEEAFRRGDFSMCKAFEDMREEGRIEGEIKGRAREIVETGFEFKFSREDILRRLQDKLHITEKEAQEYLDSAVSDFERNKNSEDL